MIFGARNEHDINLLFLNFEKVLFLSLYDDDRFTTCFKERNYLALFF